MSTADGNVVGTTKIVDNGPASERWNIVIMGDGYQAAQLGQYATDVQGIIGTILATAPFDALQTGINVFRIDVASTDSGAADPVACGGTGAAPHTYFDSRFCGDGQIRRLLVANNQTVLTTAAAQVPQFHLAIVLVNSVIYGGSGGQVAVLSLAAGVAEVALHEIGHSAFGLADEYESWAGCGVDAPGTHDHHPPGEPAQPNVTLDSNRATNKWRGLILNTTAMPTTTNANCAQCDTQASPVPAGTVGAFEGAHYYHCGAFRPAFDCRMRALGFPFCAVCQDVIKRTLEPFYLAANVLLNIIVHLQDIGDVAYHESEWAGTKGQARRLEGFQISASSGPAFEYMAHLQNLGDTPWLPSGQFVGTRGQSRRLEGFAIRLVPSSQPYTVRYRAHLQDIGDTGWVLNGAFCGTRGESRRVEAIWVQIEPGNN